MEMDNENLKNLKQEAGVAEIKPEMTVLAQPQIEKKRKRKNGEINHREDFPAETPEVLDKELLRVLMEVRNGNFSVRMPIDQVGISGKICDTLNEIISINEK